MSLDIGGSRSSFEVAVAVLRTMHAAGVAPIPRNYSLYYEALIGTNRILTNELSRLGSSPTQSDIDNLAAIYQGAATASVYEAVHDQISEHVSGAARLLEREQHVLENYNKLLTDSVGQLTKANQQTVDVLKNLVSSLSRATGAALTHGEKTRHSYSRSKEDLDEVFEQLERYKAAATTDSLTGLRNRRAFDEELAAAYNERELLPVVALVLADVDHFKRINDQFGHPVGDRLLVSLAAVLRRAAPSTAFVSRVGGEEFAVIMRGKLPGEVSSLVQRIRAAIAKQRFTVERLGLDLGRVTMSFGVAMGSQASSAEDLYRAADVALYRAKNNGRNQVVLFEDNFIDPAQRDWLIYRK